VAGFDLIRGQHRALGLLTTLLRKGQIPHALVFTGIDGIGKQTVARALAMACNCTNPQPYPEGREGVASSARINACGQCRSCRRIQADQHPDILHLRPSGDMIRIAVVRDLIQRLAVKPYEQGRRVVILAEAHTMNPEAGNALLKLLEEPPRNTLLILTARQLADLLPTIASRCQQIRFAPLQREDLTALLTTEGHLTPPEAEAAAALSGGSYTRALKMARADWIPRRQWLAGELGRLRDRTTTLHLALAENLASGKTQLPDVLAWMLGWYRDLIVFPFQPDRIVNRDLDRQIQFAAGRQDPLASIDCMKAVQAALKALQDNANPRLTMETLVLQLAAA
jgi:DNA polymerase III subunit delta'